MKKGLKKFGVLSLIIVISLTMMPVSANTNNENMEKSSYGFFKAYGYTQALKILEEQSIDNGGSTNIGADNDATSLENFKRSLSMVRYGNTLRTTDTNFPECENLKVSPVLFAISQVQINATANASSFNHSQLYNVGENIAAGSYQMTDIELYNGWYDSEKQVYDYISAKGWTIADVKSDENKYNDVMNAVGHGNIQTGHYLSLISSHNTVTGTAYIYSKTASKDGWCCNAGQVFDNPDYSEVVTNDDIMSIDVFEAQFNAYYEKVTESYVGTWKKDANGWWYQYKNGGYPTNREVEINGYIYYFNRSGYMVKGWQKVGQHWKYYNPKAYNGCPEGSMRKSAWVGNYYVGDDGIMLTSQWVDSGRYYVNEDGLWVQPKWVKTNNKWWYRHPDGSYTTNGLETIGGKLYCFDSTGYMITGWKIIDGSWRYFDGSGAMATDRWIGNYYVDNNGCMVTNSWIYFEYYVDGNGLYRPGTWKKDANGWWYQVGNTYAKDIMLILNGICYFFDSNGYWIY